MQHPTVSFCEGIVGELTEENGSKQERSDLCLSVYPAQVPSTSAHMYFSGPTWTGSLGSGSTGEQSIYIYFFYFYFRDLLYGSL